jgi:alanine racemase
LSRSEITIDLGALRRNARTLLRALAGAELWAVVKANGYGHGAADVAGAALDAGVEAKIVERFSAAADHPVALEFPEGEYLKGLLILKG